MWEGGANGDLCVSVSLWFVLFFGVAMLAYAVQRILGVVAIMVAMSFLVFAATQLLPGNVAHTILGQFATNQQIALLQQSLGLNDPWWQQYGRWAAGVLQGDLWRSL